MLKKLTKICFITTTLFVVLFASAVDIQAQAYKKQYKVCGNKGDGSVLTCPVKASEQAYLNRTYQKVKVFKRDGTSEEQVQRVTSGLWEDSLGTLAEQISGATYVSSEGDGTNAQYNLEFSPGLNNNFITATGFMFENEPIEPASVWAQNTLKDITTKINPVQEVVAQESTVYFPGLGYEILQPIRTFWNVNRNIAYGLLIIVVMVIALLILFRRQLNGKDAVSLMNSLPSIILSLLLITFSYPLSGFFIDIITIGSNFVQAVLVSTPGSPGYNTVWRSKIETDPATKAFDFIPWDQPFESSQEEGKYAVQIDDAYMSAWLIFGTANVDITSEDDNISLLPTETLSQTGPLHAIVSNIGRAFVSTGASDTGTTMASGILNLIFAFAALTASVRIFFSLLNAYLTLILYPIISPFLFLVAALPSMTSAMIENFVRTMLAAALSFVGVYALFLFIVVITYEPLLGTFSFLPPLLGYEASSNIELQGGLVRMLIGYGLFLAAPMIPEMIKENLKAAGAGAFGKEIIDRTKAAGQTGLKLGQSVVSGGVGRAFPAGH